MKKIFLFFLLPSMLFVGVCNGEKIIEGKPQMFTTTGYYSPLRNQSFYITGSYEAEIRLNGRGLWASDGTPVYAGMMAAPKSISFGTKIYIPSMGYGVVHDRGQAIVEKGERAIAKNDRLDLWMGYGDEGLLRALAWGITEVEGKVFPADAEVPIGFNFDIPPTLGEILDLPARPVFGKNLFKGNTGELVILLQRALYELGYYEGLLEGVFNENVYQAVLKFQIDNYIVKNEGSTGAGTFGPKTRLALTSKLYKQLIQEKILEAWEKFHFGNDFGIGSRNHEVLKLQEILVRQEIMDVYPTGYFGPVTEDALKEFQLFHGIIRNKWANGAGKVGPRTRAKLNEFLEEEKTMLSNEKELVFSYKKSRQRLNFLAHKELVFGQLFTQK